MTYSDKLKSPKWQKKRLEVLNRDNFKCCLCGDEETELHVHHLKYTAEPWSAPISDLETLCKYCHHLTEATKEWGVRFIKCFGQEDKKIILDDSGTINLFKDGDIVLRLAQKSDAITSIVELSNFPIDGRE